MDMISTALIIATITAIPCLYSLYVQKRAADIVNVKTHDAEYRIHCVVKLLILAETGMSLWIIAFSVQQRTGGKLFFGVIGLGFLLLGLAGLYCCYKVKVKFEGEQLSYYDGFKTKIVNNNTPVTKPPA